MDKHGSMLLLRTLFQGCMDPSKTAFPYASFARSVNLKWVHDTFELPEVDIQTLTGFRWTRNEAPKDFLIRHLLANRPYLSDFVHCHTPRLPRCLFAHMTATTINPFEDELDGTDADTPAIVTTVDDDELTALGPSTQGPTASEATIEGDISSIAHIYNNASAAAQAAWFSTIQNAMQGVTHTVLEDEAMLGPDESLLSTPPLLPIQQPIATAMPFAHPAPASPPTAESSSSSLSSNSTGQQQEPSSTINGAAEGSAALLSSEPSPPAISPATSTPAPTQSQVSAADGVIETPQEMEQVGMSAVSTSEPITVDRPDDNIAAMLELPSQEAAEDANDQGEAAVSTTGTSLPSTSSTQSTLNEIVPPYGFQQVYSDASTQLHSRASTSSSSGFSSRQFLATWPLTKEQTRSLVYLDLRYAVVSDTLIMSLSLNCRKIESLKVATHLQHFPHSYSVTDHALSCLVAAQHSLKLVHVENHREISQGHELVRTIDTLAKLHGESLESLVLKSHDFQNCRLAELGKACKKLVKFSAPGGMHLFREEVLGLTEACKLTLEHLDFSNSDIETDCLMTVMKGLFTPVAARGVLKALVLLGMEDTLNQETCQAIGDYGSGLDCFRLDILESEAKDVALMLSRPCALNLRVLTLGCHDVHGDLANDILEQIALNCRNVELLDVNHWQFSATAIEGVLRDCGMLRYLNVSYTDISEDTAQVICRCLGEVKEAVAPTGPVALDSLSTPLPAIALTASQMQTPAPVGSNGGTNGQQSAPADHNSAERLLSLASADEDATLEDEATGVMDDERVVEMLRKRGIDMRPKDEADDEDGNEQMDTNMDDGQQFLTPIHSANGGGKKQSQMGLVHHQAHAMDLRTIMNLDLDEALDMDLSMNMDEATGMDLDMRLDLQRYHCNFSYVDEEDEEEIGEMQDEDVEMRENDEEYGDEGEQSRSREPKGKEVYIDRDEDQDHGPDGTASFSTTESLNLSSSYGSTSSASSSASSSSSSSSSSSPSKNLEALLHRALSDVQEPTSCTPLLPPLPIPSRHNVDDDSNDTCGQYAMAVGSCASAGLPCTSTTLGLPLMPDSSQSDSSQPSFEPEREPVSSTPISVPLVPDTVASQSSEILTPLPSSEASMKDNTVNNKDLDWTAESRLEQVNVECCSQLSHTTMAKIKSLATTRQASLVTRQGRKKSRMWVENEHDMMMTRLAVERGPDLPPERLQTRIGQDVVHAPASSENVVASEGAAGSSIQSEQTVSGLEPAQEELTLAGEEMMVSSLMAEVQVVV
ncbi:unnamed protein product [Mortierella alpina]